MKSPRRHHPSLSRQGCALVAIAWLGLPLSGLAGPEPARDPLEGGFLQPPHDARPKTFWHWMNNSVTKEGITADLEAMSRSGIGGAQVIYAALRNRDTRRHGDNSALCDLFKPVFATGLHRLVIDHKRLRTPFAAPRRASNRTI